ncbi:hypothetical protein [Duganella lactea]|uniref:hypothetical protein n=1 Tax=Duganella lactea TaxID=2692173 RepID=UPI001E59CB1A|nr:hypothetical protein [Duganella lactea]
MPQDGYDPKTQGMSDSGNQLSRDKALSFWRGMMAGAPRKERVLLVAETAEGRVIGTVQLITAQPDNQPHQAARDEGKTVLVLDTVTGGDAGRLYQRAGWQTAGVVPNYALKPDGALCGTTFFYKQL